MTADGATTPPTEPRTPNGASHPAAAQPGESPEADAIVSALARIRGRGGRGFRGPGGHWRGSHEGGGPHDRFGQGWGGRPGLQGPPGFSGHSGGPGGSEGSEGSEAGGARGPRGRFGGPALLRLLGQLAHATSPLSVSELASRIGVDQPRASRLVQQAVEREFAVREADPADARRTRVRLTDAGQRAVHGFRGQQRADMTVALDALDGAERRELARLITKLADAWPEV